MTQNQANDLPAASLSESWSAQSDDWRALSTFNLYRLLVAATLCGMVFSPFMAVYVDVQLPGLARNTTILYLVLAVILFFLGSNHKLKVSYQTYVGMLVDISLVILTMRALGGLNSGLGVIPITVIAAGSTLLNHRKAISIAAFAVIALLVESYAGISTGRYGYSHMTLSAFYGMAYLATSVVAYWVTERVEMARAVASERGADLAALGQLNELIVRRMRTGVLVVNSKDQIRIMNEAAWYLLGMPDKTKATLAVISKDLDDRFLHWQMTSKQTSDRLQASGGIPPYVPRFAALGEQQDSDVLIFLEDSSMVSRRAEEMTLNALDKLAASIAHEIRNPLGAVSHAAQLLAESDAIVGEDARLLEIMKDHCTRMDDIVGNVLQLSQRKPSEPKTLQLKSMLEAFTEDFLAHAGHKNVSFELAVEPDDLAVLMDSSQLHQVLWNLCQNTCRYGRDENGKAQITFRAHHAQQNSQPVLDIVDTGDGVPQGEQQTVFQPFYTTSTKGSGLGLYVSAHLCLSNQAELEYIAMAKQGACFRISFALPRLDYQETT